MNKNKNKLFYDPNKRLERNNSFYDEEEYEEQESNPIEEAVEEVEEVAKDVAKDMVKEQVKTSVSAGVKKGAVAVKSGIAKFAASNPYVLAGIGVVLFLLLIILLILFAVQKSELNSLNMAMLRQNKAYWWPVGSLETEEIDGVEFAIGEPSSITTSSQFGERKDPLTGEKKVHYGLDISGGGMYNYHNIIASKDGVVLHASDIGNGFGEYVVLKHENDEYTLYGHLHTNTIVVNVGDTVSQGQVLGKMGTTGRSTGVHLHFEIRVGANHQSAAVNPLDYIDPTNPRPIPLDYDMDNSAINLYKTDLTKYEFKAYLTNYSKNKVSKNRKNNFDKNFLNNSDLIYDTSLTHNVNPELVVSFAADEGGFAPAPGTNYNFWGLAIYNETGVTSSSKINSMEEGVQRFAAFINKYANSSSYQHGLILSRAEVRQNEECDPLGYGSPYTLSGILSIYAHFGDYLASIHYNKDGSYQWGMGGCVFLKSWISNDVLGQKYTQGYYDGRCPSSYTCSAPSSGGGQCKKATIEEQCDYTAYTVRKRLSIRNSIFGM